MNFTVDTNSLKVGEIARITCDLTHLTTSNGVISEYDTFDDHQKMIYEMVLLTKKVSNDYGTGSITAEDAIKQYRQELSGYKTIADKNGYEWDNVLLEVSAELQQESIYS